MPASIPARRCSSRMCAVRATIGTRPAPGHASRRISGSPEAVHFRHLAIHQDQLDAVRIAQVLVQREPSVAGQAHRVAALGEEAAHHQLVHRVVLGDQDAWGVQAFVRGRRCSALAVGAARYSSSRASRRASPPPAGPGPAGAGLCGGRSWQCCGGHSRRMRRPCPVAHRGCPARSTAAPARAPPGPAGAVR